MKRFLLIFFLTVGLVAGMYKAAEGFEYLAPAENPLRLSWKESVQGGFSVEVILSKTEISLDETLEATLILTFPSTHFPDIDTLRMNLLKYAGLEEPPFALKEEKIEDKGKKIHFILEPQLPGLHFISLYQIPFLPTNPKQDKPVEIISDIFQVNVSLPKEKKNLEALAFPLLSLTEQFPITIDRSNRKKGIENENLINKERAFLLALLDQKTLPWGQITGFILFAFVILIARIQPKKIPDKRKEHIKRIRTAKKRALNALLALPKGSLRKERAYKRLYAELSRTIRNYFEESFQLKASTQTTQEFLYKISSIPNLDGETQAALTEFMHTSDRVKFASHIPTEEECEEAQKTAKLFIERISSRTA